MRLILDSTTLRRLTVGDLKTFQAYRTDPDIAKYQSWEAMDDARAAGFLNHMSTMDPLLIPGQWTQIAVADTVSNALLGDMGLHLSADQTEAELGITLAKSAHGQGHATRAFALATRWLFETTPIAQINAWADVRNTTSCRLMTRAGFVQTGVEVTDGLSEAVFLMKRPAP